MDKARCEIGLIGLGAMGANLALNLAEKGRALAVFNRSPEKTRQFLAQAPAGLDLSPAFPRPSWRPCWPRPEPCS